MLKRPEVPQSLAAGLLAYSVPYGSAEKRRSFGLNPGCGASDNGNTSKEFRGRATYNFCSFLKSGCNIMPLARILMVFCIG
jgi:hypothetical protein